MALIDTEPHQRLSWRFKAFVFNSRLPGFGALLGWLAGRKRLRRSSLILGGAFNDRSLLNGEFDEFLLRPLSTSRLHSTATGRLLRSFNYRMIKELPELHGKIKVPVQLIWGEKDIFFPVVRAREMLSTFPNAHLTVIPDAGLFSHEERPAEVAAALLPFVMTPLG
jgi:haloalkane dehalogenase